MKRFADPTTCPDCGSAIPEDPDGCPTCKLPLRNHVAADLFTTLGRADELLDQLRGFRSAARVEDQAGAGPVDGLDKLDHRDGTLDQSPPRPTGKGFSIGSVPGILLAIGGLLLLVAALVFLAVAWAIMPISVRTLVLVGLTGGVASIAVVTGRRGLRAASESLSAVAAGFVALSGVGAYYAGWLPESSEAATALVSLVVVAASVALSLTARVRSAEITASIAAFVSYAAAWAALGDTESLVLAMIAPPLLVAVVTFLPQAMSWFRAGVLVVLGVALLHLLGRGAIDVGAEPTFADIWTGPGWLLLLAAGYLAAPVVLAKIRPHAVPGAVAHVSLAVSATVIAYVATAPAGDESVSVRVTAALLVVAASVALAEVAGRAGTSNGHRYAVLTPGWLGAVVASTLTGPIIVIGLERITWTAIFGDDAGVRVGDARAISAVVVSPWLLVAVTVAVLGLFAASVRVARPEAVLAVSTRSNAMVIVLASLSLSAMLASAAAGLPVAVVSACLVIGALAMFGVGRGSPAALAMAVTWLALGALTAVPSALLAAGVGAVALAAIVWLIGSGQRWAYGILPLAAAFTVWAAGVTATIPTDYLGFAVLLVLGAIIVVRPVAPAELTAGLAAIVAAPVAIWASDSEALWTSLHLTLAGLAVAASALLHPSRRWFGWLGGALLTLASWVRLGDLGVDVPEAYSLPPAIALLLIGLVRMRLDSSVSTMAMLGPGLGAAALTSLAAGYTEPISLRAGLVLAISVAAMLLGARLSWQAPLVVGAVSAVLIGLRIGWPAATLTPIWIWIGLVGLTLTIIGITWESQLNRIRATGAYLARLR